MIFFRKDEKPKKNPKEAADGFFAKGQWSEALAAYESMIDKAKPDVKILRRIADLRVKIGKNNLAVEAYRQLAELYAKSGFLVQAIAVYKILQRLDPSAEDIGKKLAGLYSERGFTGAMKDTLKADEALTDPAFDAQEAEAAAMPKIPLFSDLPPEAFGEVIKKLVPHQLVAGQFLFREGDPGDSIFIVTSGTVVVERNAKTLATLEEGSFFGEGAFFSREPRNADVKAEAETELLEIRREDLEVLMKEYQGVSSALNSFYRNRIVDRMMASSDIMAEVEAGVRREIEELFVPHDFAKGDVLVREGDGGTAIYFLTRGNLEVSTVPPGEGEPIVLAQLGPGDFFGEVALLSGRPRTATVTALSDGEAMKVDGEVLTPYLDRYPNMKKAMMELREKRAEATIAAILSRF